MNFIVICLDSLRRDHVGCYGNSWIRTPYLDRFAKNHIVFENMFPNGIPTLPFRRGLMQGRRVHPFRESAPRHIRNSITLLGWHSLVEKHLTIQEILGENNYTTGFITDVPHMFAPDVNFHIGFDSWQFLRGNECDRYRMGGSRRRDQDDFLVDEVKGTIQQRYLEQSMLALDEARSEEDFFAPRVFRAAAKWLEQNARYYENFYLHIDSFDPHEPWNPPREYRFMYDRDYKGREIILPQNIMENMTEAEGNHIRAMYAGKVTMVDRWFGYFMDKLDHMGLHEDTAVVVVSDHGHPLGEHGMWRKVPPALRFNMLNAVMLMSLPDTYQSHGKRYSTMVHEYDIAPTLLSLAGIEASESMNGKSLKPILTGETDVHRDYAAGGYNDHTYIRTEDYYYYKSLLDPEKRYLFDQMSDPQHMTNLADSQPETVAAMEEMVTKELDGWTLPPDVGTSGYLNPYKPNYTVREDAWTSTFD